MSDTLRARLRALEGNATAELLGQIRRGIEKESLRIRRDGVLAQTPHPPSLGSALTHPHVTTDYSEALLEFVTPTLTSIDATLEFLSAIHRFVYQNIGEEMLWVNSMPCILRGDTSIPIARYGTSNIGHMKYVYRRGLGYRYGRLMQTIAGIHYNFSVPDAFWSACAMDVGAAPARDAVSAHYFAGVRNFHRYCWLLFYLFGASPAVCRSFLEDREHDLEALGPASFCAPFATTIRMSSLGYRNNAQAAISVSYDDVDAYVASLRHATATPHAAYERIGVRENGDYRQLNANLLQIDNEYYAVIRPKRVAKSGETPTHALHDRGVEYLEVRCVDLDPFCPVGIDPIQVRFLDVFLLFCLLQESPLLAAGESDVIAENKNRTVLRGREPGLELMRDGAAVPLRRWGSELCDALGDIAAVCDAILGGRDYAEAVTAQIEKLRDDERTPAAAILREIRANRESFFEFAMRKAVEHEGHFKQGSLDAATRQRFEALSQRSLAQQREIEAADDIDFDEFLARYFAQ